MPSKRNNATMVDISGWLPVPEARAKMKEMIANGSYTKDQIRLSSQRFANKKDKTDGYEAKVLVIPDIHPELETGLTYSHGTPKVVNKRVKDQIKNKLPLDKIKLNGNIKVGDNKYQILEVVNNKSRTKLYYWLRGLHDTFTIAQSPYNKDYKNISIIKENEKDSEQSFCDWTRLCNSVTTREDRELYGE